MSYIAVDSSHMKYENCRVYHPDGTLMFQTTRKRVSWYLKRHLAVVVSDEPLSIRLTFEPNGDGTDLLENRENLCYVCGVTESLTMHHIVPQCFRKRFPEEMKTHQSHDVVPLCRKCHNAYEVTAALYKDALVRKHAPTAEATWRTVCKIRSLHSASTRESVPAQRASEMGTQIEDMCASMQLGLEDALAYARPDVYMMVVNGEGIDSLVVAWRKHFIEHTSPRHMPDWWRVDYPVSALT